MNATYSVILKSGLPAREVEFLRIYCGVISSPSGGEPLMHLPCNQIDASHHMYIEIETVRQKDQAIFVIRIPHHYVLLIDGSAKRPSLGFVQQ